MTNPSTLSAAQSLADKLPRLILAAEQLAFAAAPGPHGRRRAGTGTSFWQFRHWQNGDDIRNIDWRRSAQGDRLYFREREWEAQANVELSLENTPTLDFSSNNILPTKRDRAVLLLLALAGILLRSGERVTLSGEAQPAFGPKALSKLAAALLSGATTAEHNPKARRVIFGDFLQLNKPIGGPAGGAIMQILDPAECEFPYRGRLIFEGLSGEASLEAVNAKSWQAAYRSRIEAQRDRVKQAALAAGQTPIFHRTDAAPVRALAALHQALMRR